MNQFIYFFGKLQEMERSNFASQSYYCTSSAVTCHI